MLVNVPSLVAEVPKLKPEQKYLTMRNLSANVKENTKNMSLVTQICALVTFWIFIVWLYYIYFEMVVYYSKKHFY